ncbi:Arc family DNA-binding protein [Komagataeibacter oboediens]|nr:Arc family DNA-binding protein [Komagataeibacter oboediens]
MSDEDRYRRFNLRIPKDVFAALQVTADARSHSMNAEIIQRLEQSLQINGLASTVKTDELSPEESLMLGIWRAMSHDEKMAMMAFLRAFMARSSS